MPRALARMPLRLVAILCFVALITSKASPAGAKQTGVYSVKVSTTKRCSGTGSGCNCANVTEPIPYNITVSLTLPPDSAANGQENAVPLIIFFHGFGGKLLLENGNYEPYKKAATEKGFAFLEYDVADGPLYLPITDAAELDFLDGIMSWLEEGNEEMTGNLDLKRIAVAGHSRGGKMAALHYAIGKVPIFAAYLHDPVDNACFGPVTSNCYPSGVEKLLQSKKPIGATGATIKGCCNPAPAYDKCSTECNLVCNLVAHNPCTGYDYRDFLAVGHGSVEHTIKAGHMQFADPKTLAGQLASTVCGKSSLFSRNVSTESAGYMMSWITSQLPTDPVLTSSA